MSWRIPVQGCSPCGCNNINLYCNDCCGCTPSTLTVTISGTGTGVDGTWTCSISTDNCVWTYTDGNVTINATLTAGTWPAPSQTMSVVGLLGVGILFSGSKSQDPAVEGKQTNCETLSFSDIPNNVGTGTCAVSGTCTISCPDVPNRVSSNPMECNYWCCDGLMMPASLKFDFTWTSSPSGVCCDYGTYDDGTGTQVSNGSGSITSTFPSSVIATWDPGNCWYIATGLGSWTINEYTDGNCTGDVTTYTGTWTLVWDADIRITGSGGFGTPYLIDSADADVGEPNPGNCCSFPLGMRLWTVSGCQCCAMNNSGWAGTVVVSVA